MRMRNAAFLRLLAVLAGGLVLALCVSAAPAAASPAWWVLNSTIAPTHPVPGTTAQINVTAVDGGYKAVTGASAPVVFTDRVPAGLKIGTSKEEVLGQAGPYASFGSFKTLTMTCSQSGQVVTCELKGEIRPAENLRMKIPLEVESTLADGTSLTNSLSIRGGTVPGGGESPHSAEQKQTATVSAEPTAFGVEQFEIEPEGPEGELDTQAGSHPFQLTTTFDLAKNLEPHKLFASKEPIEGAVLPALPKDLHFTLPPGLIGNVADMPQCSEADFSTTTGSNADYCAGDTAIGVATVTLDEPITLGTFTEEVPLFNLTPAYGEPARFGFEADKVPVVLTTKVRSGSNYAVEVSVEYATQAADVLNTQVSFWGVPGDSRHDSERGWECLGGGFLVQNLEGEHKCKSTDEAEPQALLSLPTSCEGTPVASVEGVAWTGQQLGGEFQFEPFTGCDKLSLEPSITVKPEEETASTPSGMNVDIHIPQASTLSGTQLSEATVKKTVLTLPEGILASAGAAESLSTCAASGENSIGLLEGLPEEDQLQNDHFSPEEATCPAEAKVGTVTIDTPLLEQPLTGSVYLAYQDTDPFKSPLVFYIVADDPTAGVRVKLAGQIKLNQTTGQVESVFENTPPLPFEDLHLHLFNGPEATQSTPPLCGAYTSKASFSTWSGSEAEASSQFQIISGPHGGACSPSPRELKPAFSVHNSSQQAGAFTDFTLGIGHRESDQPISGLIVHLPPGMAAMISNVTPCPEPAVGTEWSCGADSEVGEATTVAGLGSHPVTLKGKVYLTAGYNGAPFGLLVRTLAHVGPFELGWINVRSRIDVNETTAAVTVTTQPGPRGVAEAATAGRDTEVLPTIIDGVPVQLREILVAVNRPEFQFNPTNCGKLEISGTLLGSEGAAAGLEQSYSAENCASLPFNPTIAVSVESNVSRLDGTGLKIKITSGSGQANIGKTKLEFPKTIPSRLETLHKACLEAVFAANPANCPEGSVVGTATAHTPVLKSPLTGPIYLVSHGGAAFPDAEIVLQGEGIKLILDGKTEISESGANKGVTSSSFESVPDAPVSTFEVELPRKTNSAFSGYGNLCEEKPTMPTRFTGQNGAVAETNTQIEVTGCASGGVKAAKAESELAKLLKQCRKLTTKHGKRAKCETTARKRVAALATCKRKYKGKAKKLASCEAKARKKYALKLK